MNPNYQQQHWPAPANPQQPYVGPQPPVQPNQPLTGYEQQNNWALVGLTANAFYALTWLQFGSVALTLSIHEVIIYIAGLAFWLLGAALSVGGYMRARSGKAGWHNLAVVGVALSALNLLTVSLIIVAWIR